MYALNFLHYVGGAYSPKQSRYVNMQRVEYRFNVILEIHATSFNVNSADFLLVR